MVGIYFSGTGNTKFCIKKFMSYVKSDIRNPLRSLRLKRGTSLMRLKKEGKIISIEDKNVLEEIKKNKEIIFAYPIYYSNIPKIVRDFILQYKRFFKEKKIFIIATMGLFSGDGTGCAARLLKHFGAKITGGLHVRMLDCISDEKVLKYSFDKNRKIVAKAKQKIKFSAKKYRNGTKTQEGLSFGSHIIGLLGQRLWFYNKTKHYTNKLKIAVSKCIGCGKCAASCPMNNLSIVKQKAVSKGKCTMCYRCINQCPKQAITLLGNKVIRQCKIENYI